MQINPDISNFIPYGSATGRSRFIEEGDIVGKSILDIGCSNGWFEIEALKRHVKKVVGIDISANAIKTARRFVRNKKAKFHITKGFKLPFADRAFDTVVCWEVIEHLLPRTDKKIFSEIFRVLKKRGRLYLSTPLKSIPSVLFDPAWWLIRHRHYNQKELIGFGNNAGLKVVKIKTGGGFYSLLLALDMYISK